MESDTAQEAIRAALVCDWEKAILLNSRILAVEPTNIDALNRIARACAENGNLKKAQLYTNRVLRIDPTNAIACKAHERWKSYKRDGNLKPISVSADAFIEEPTKTKTISLINLGDPVHIVCLNCGDKLKLAPRAHRVNISTIDDKYIGRFPDDLAIKFINLIKMGANFEVFVKNANHEEVKVFLKTGSGAVS